MSDTGITLIDPTTGQNAPAWGGYFYRIYPSGPETEIHIYGDIPTLEEFEKGETELGASLREWEYTRNAYVNAYGRGYRFAHCYSKAVPDGEVGSTHVLDMHAALTKEVFEKARAAGWPLLEEIQ